MISMNALHTVLSRANNRVAGGVLRGIGYGAIAMMVVAAHTGQHIVFLPVALLIIMSGMLFESIAQRSNNI